MTMPAPPATVSPELTQPFTCTSPALGVPPPQHLSSCLFLDLNYSLFAGMKPSEKLSQCPTGQGQGHPRAAATLAGDTAFPACTRRAGGDRHQHMDWCGVGTSHRTALRAPSCGHGHCEMPTTEISAGHECFNCALTLHGPRASLFGPSPAKQKDTSPCPHPAG